MFLAIDTVFEQCSVALVTVQPQTKEISVLSAMTEYSKREQAQSILPMIDKVLKQANVSLNEITALIFNRGPGGFSGIRINTAVVQALSVVNDTPCVGVSSLQAWAQLALDKQGITHVYVAIDARMKQVYFGEFRAHNGVMRDVVELEKMADLGEVNQLTASSASQQPNVDKNDIDLGQQDQDNERINRDNAPLDKLSITKETITKETITNKTITNKTVTQQSITKPLMANSERLMDYAEQTPQSLPIIGDGAQLLRLHPQQKTVLVSREEMAAVAGEGETAVLVGSAGAVSGESTIGNHDNININIDINSNNKQLGRTDKDKTDMIEVSADIVAPDAVVLAKVGIAQFLQTGGVPAEQALPVYLRHNTWKTLKEQGK